MRQVTHVIGPIVALFGASMCDRSRAQEAAFWIHEATVQRINAAFSTGELTSEQLVSLYLNRIDAYDKQGPTINSIIMLNPNALDTAKALDIERQTTGPRSVLHGIPILLKDQLDTFDMPTTSGSLALKDFVPPDDAFVVRKLRDAGAIILGKTNLDEFGCCSATVSSLGGQTRNPYDTARITGGSSGGTAAAIAANFAVMGTGSDWWGSIQEPASFQSVVGLMPTRSLISGDGGSFSSERRGVTGPMARTVADAVAMLGIIAGVDPADPVTAASDGKIPDNYFDFLDADGLAGARIGIVRNFVGGSREIRELFDQATAQMESSGAQLVTVNIDVSSMLNSYYNDFEYKMNRYLESLGDAAPYTSLRELIDSRNYLPSLDSNLFDDLRGDIPPDQDPVYVQIIALRDRFEADVLNLMDSEELDALVYPPILSLPPRMGTTANIWETEGDFRNMNLSPWLGFPSITVPAGFTAAGLPVGIEFLGRPFSEPTLIRLAYGFEQTTQFRQPPKFTPPLPGDVPFGDFDWNGIVDVRDVDQLSLAMRAGQDLTFDLNGDGLLDDTDLTTWVHVAMRAWFGDANLDGLFQSDDLVLVLAAGEYEDTIVSNSTWATGDWNGDGEFTSADLVLALSDGGYERGPRAAVVAVPEPTSNLWVTFMAIGWLGPRRSLASPRPLIRGRIRRA